MNSITETGYLRLEIDISVEGPLSLKESNKITTALFKFFKDRNLNVRGTLKHIGVTALMVDKSSSKSDTSSI